MPKAKFAVLFLSAALLSAPVFANEASPVPGGAQPAAAGEMHGKKKYHAPATRQEAIERAKERVKKLETMTDEEWKQKHDARMKRKAERHEKWKQHKAAQGGQPLPGGGEANAPAKQPVPGGQ